MLDSRDESLTGFVQQSRSPQVMQRGAVRQDRHIPLHSFWVEINNQLFRLTLLGLKTDDL
jgi:hypothetical protein